MATPPAEAPSADDPVGDDVHVYRLIPTWQCDVIDGAWEFQSAAFDNASPLYEGDASDRMSVVLGDHLTALERDPANLPEETGWAGNDWGVAVLMTGFLCHEEGQEIIRTPEADEPAHGDVCGQKNTKRRRRFKKHAAWVIRPKTPPT